MNFEYSFPGVTTFFLLYMWIVRVFDILGRTTGPGLNNVKFIHLLPQHSKAPIKTLKTVSRQKYTKVQISSSTSSALSTIFTFLFISVMKFRPQNTLPYSSLIESKISHLESSSELPMANVILVILYRNCLAMYEEPIFGKERKSAFRVLVI